MESKASREALENIVIAGDGTNAPQYMIHRLPENAQLLSSELLQNHNGLVVDLGGTDFIPVSYTSEDLLSQDLTEEDRNLAAALVAVQFSQQQKQQQLQDASLPSLVANGNLGVSLIPGTKILEDSSLIISEKSGTSYLRIVNSDNIYVEQQAIQPSKLVETIKYTAGEHLEEVEEEEIQVQEVPDAIPQEYKKEPQQHEDDDEEKLDSDHESIDVDARSEQRTSKKSLPHKKRISRKLNKKSSPSTSSSKKIMCNLCEQSFSSHDEFAQHEMLCTTTITPVTTVQTFNCQLCNQPFTEQLKFFEHLKNHYEPGGGIIPVPIAEPQEEIKQVKPEKPDPPEKPHESLLSSLLNLTCIECNKTFRRQKTFEAHMRDIHTQKEEPLDEFSEPEDLMEGINVVVDDNGGIDDDDDPKAWYREEDLQQTEEDLKELEADNSHVCHLCKQPFPLRAILLQHLVTCRVQSGNTESAPLSVVKKINKKKQKKPSHDCTECDRTFVHRNSLVYHMRSHTGIRPHQCEQCGKSFFASSALKVHLRLHSGDKPYSCEHCGRRFRQWGDLKYHITSLHTAEKSFQCEYCGKEFARKYSLVVHRRIHTGERNYKCDFCTKTFRASSYLQNHRKIHTGEKPHSCEVCGKPFRVRSDMKRHQKTHMKVATPGGGPKRAAKSAAAAAAAQQQAQQQQALASAKVEIVKAEEEELSCELHIEDEEAAGQLLTEYTTDPLEEEGRTTMVKVPAGSRNLYINGHELFLVTYPNEIRSVDGQTSVASGVQTWVHASTS